MMKRIIALLLALILTVGLLPTVALAAEETANTNVVPGSIGTDGKWSQTPPTQPKVDGVKKVDKTAEKVAGTDNQYKVTLTVVLEQTEEEQKPGAAATVLVLDTSGSMAYCAECGAKDDCVHNYVSVPGKPSKKETYYYKYTNENGQVRFGEAYYCDGKHTARFWLKHPAGWFTTSSDSLDHKPTRDSLAGQTMYVKSTTPRASRLDAAKVAAENFLKTYSGLTFNTDGTVATGQESKDLDRYVSVVTFAKSVTLQQGWIDVSNPTGYNTVKNLLAGESLKADGGTNLDAGLCYAEYLLKQNAVKDATKNVIALSDGEPTFYLSDSYYCDDYCGGDGTSVTIGNQTYYVHGRGSSCNNTTKTSTDSAAADVKKVPADLYTICFGGATEMMKKPDNGNWGFTVGKYMEDLASEKDGKKLAYTASNANELNTAFAAITDTIVSGLNTGTVKDSLPTGITGSTATVNGQALTSPMTWKLDENFHKEETETTTTDGKTKTTYTYTKTYYVTINPETVVPKVINDEKYAPLNGETTLTVTVDGKEKEIPFPIPAGKVTMPSYTVTGTIDNNGAVTGSGQTVNAGGSSAAMTFTPAAGYKIISVKEKVGEVETTITDFAETGYTYPVKNDIRANITVDVKTAKRSDLSYTVRYLEKGTTNEIRTADTVNGQEFSATITGDSINHPAITGFIYDSCSPESITIGTDSAQNVITLYYTRDSYTVTFKDGANGAVFEDETQQVEYGKAIPSHADPVRPGYNFTVWTSEPANYQPGTGTMPANNITFTAQWTEKTSVTISYVAKDGGSVDPDSETLNPDTGEATGSTATASTGYTFDGWYSDSECTEAKKVGGQATFIPTKPTTGWVDGTTFYAKFTKNTYTVTYTDGVNGTAFGDQSTPDVAYGAPIPAFNGTPTRAGYNFTGWTSSVTGVTTSSTMPDSNVTFTAGWAPKNKATINYEVVGPANCGSVTPVNEEVFVDAEKASGSTATAEPNYRFVGWYSDSECTEANKVSGEVTFTPPKPDEGGWVTTTYYAKFVPSTVTFDLNTLITKKFEAAADSKPIPDGSYTFKAEIVEADSSFGELMEGAKYEGTVTLNAADTASFDFGDNRYLKLAAGPHYYRVSEIGDTVTGTTGTITYDSRVFCLTIVVNDDGEVGSVNVTPLVVVYSTAEEAVEFEGDNHITFTNTYFEKKDPNSVTVDFSQYVRKHLTVTGDKSFNGATFTVNFTEGMFIKKEKENEPKIASIEVYAADAGVNERGLPNLTASVTYGADERDAGYKPFDGADLTIRVEGTYFYLVSEVIPDGATGYDTNEYIIGISVENDGDHLKVAGVGYSKYIENSQEDPEITWNEGPTFYNTIDTGKDDYYPIIIPTIINKDTGMLNKTDHFAYVIGYPDGTVHPNGQITRAEVATIFFRLLRDEVRDGAFATSNTYSDVAYGKWYNNPISTMSALGIITGYPDGTFKPNKPITRAEFAAIAARFDETQSGKSATFSDVIGHWAAKEIGIAYYNDWIKGYPDGTFKPDQNITRAEAMTLINRVLERKPESPADLLTNMNKWTDNMDTSKWYYLDVQEATNSHGYTRKTFNYELWRQMLPDPDWSRYER